MEKDELTAGKTDDDGAGLRAQVDELRAHLEQAQQGTHAFVAMLAHELRTPLGAILMWAHVLRMGRQSDRDAAVDAIETSARAQSQLICRLLDVTRAAAGRLRIDKLPVDMAAVVRSAAEELQAAAAVAKVALEVSIPAVGATPTVLGDALRLREMVTTLVANAIRASAADAAVQVVLTRTAETIQLTVRDHGPSPSPDELAKLFIPFQMTGEPERRAPGTLGLELPLVRLLTDLHNGTVTARAADSGDGSILVLELPAAE